MRYVHANIIAKHSNALIRFYMDIYVNNENGLAST